MQNKVVFIVGPTAVGKTELAIKLAQNYNGSLVSADSVQVYKGLDIVSGKDLPKTSKFVSLPKLSKNGYNTGFYTGWGVPIFLLDIVDSTFSFSVSNYQKLATDTIQHVSKENKLPIVVGGTGLYVKALIEGIETNSIKPDLKLRNKLESLKISKLQSMISPEKFMSMSDSDWKNKRRLIRVIEVGSWKTGDGSLGISNKETKKFESLVIGLYCDREVLKKRIDKRVEERLANGALDEVGGLFKNYQNLTQQVKDANGYKQLFSYLQNKINLEEAVYRWKISEYKHAKNQMTWFRKYGEVKWFDIAEIDFEKDIAASLKKFLS